MATSTIKFQNHIAGTDNMTIPSEVFSSSPAKMLHRSQNIVKLYIDGNLSSTLAGNDGVICTLPTGFRPSSQRYVMIYGKYGTGDYKACRGLIKADGTVNTAHGSSTFSGSIGIDTTFFI